MKRGNIGACIVKGNFFEHVTRRHRSRGEFLQNNMQISVTIPSYIFINCGLFIKAG